MVPVEGSEQKLDADLVLIAAGFLGTEKYVADAFGVKLNARTNVEDRRRPLQDECEKSLYRRRYAQRTVTGCMGNP